MSQETEHGTDATSGIGDNKLLYPWIGVIAIGLLIGLYGVFRLLTEGTVTLGVHEQLPWGILISTYVFLALLSTGICIGVTSLAAVFGMEKYEPLVKRGILLSIVTLVAGGLVIIISLGRPERSIIQLLLSPNPGSPMWWMIVFYGVYMLSLLGEFYLLEWKGTTKLSVSVLALLAPIAAGSTLGAIFGLSIRPYYDGFFGPAFLILTAVLSGIALVALVTIVEDKVTGRSLGGDRRELVTETLGKYMGLMLGITIVAVAWKYIMGLSATDSATAAAHEYMLFGPPSWWVWTFGIVLGLLVPFVLVANPATRSINGVLAASVLVLVGMFASRLEYVMGGQVVALTQDAAQEFPFVSYSPTGVELAIVVLGFAVFALLYTVGYVLFDLDEVPSHGGAGPVETPTTDASGGETDD